ncbi:MAG: YezD family protein [Dehalococcoidia bacterium]
MAEPRTNAPLAAPGAPSAQEQAVLAEVLSAIRSVRYGYVQITLQDARVVQIDTLEKKRFDR